MSYGCDGPKLWRKRGEFSIIMGGNGDDADDDDHGNGYKGFCGGKLTIFNYMTVYSIADTNRSAHHKLIAYIVHYCNTFIYYAWLCYIVHGLLYTKHRTHT